MISMLCTRHSKAKWGNDRPPQRASNQEKPAQFRQDEKSVPVPSGQQHDQKAPQKLLNNNANIQDSTESFYKWLWKGKYKTDGTTASRTVRFINNSWAEKNPSHYQSGNFENKGTE